MRRQPDILRRRPQSGARKAVVAAVVLIGLVIGLLRVLSGFYVNFLWFSSQGLSGVWGGVVGTKLALAGFFVTIFFLFSWANLSLVDRFSGSAGTLGPEDEIVKRYKVAVQPRRFLVRGVVSLVLGLLMGVGTASEWNNWILFRDGLPFQGGAVDPQLHTPLSFYVFKLPFLYFLDGWCLAALAVTFVAVTVAAYLNGQVRIQGPGPRTTAHLKVHLSLLAAGVALAKAGGYVLQRYGVDTATNGTREGAFYTDVHARLPALSLLAVISLFAFAIFILNVKRQGWVLPAIAVGLWAFVALVIGVIYPALVQRFSVDPSQEAKQLPYLQRNLEATRYALDLKSIATEPFADSSTLNDAEVLAHPQSLGDVRVWNVDEASLGFNKLQDIHGYYYFPDVSVNRVPIGGTTTPIIIGVRELDESQLPTKSWVAVHLEYTHGFGLVISPAAQQTAEGGLKFLVKDLPPKSAQGAPKVEQPAVYYGVGESGYVVTDTKQGEFDYATGAAASRQSHYKGAGGVKVSSFVRRAAFSLRFGDMNLLLSHLITSSSRVQYVRDVKKRVEKAAPFLSVDSHPYPVIANGQLYWMVDAYTTTNDFPYSQRASTSAVGHGSGLSGRSFNYIRNSVKVLVNAYTGKMTFYAWDQQDPILQVYERAFPSLFVPSSHMPAAIRAQLRYPYDLFAVQAAAYSQYHVTSARSLYTASNAWAISGSPSMAAPSLASSGNRQAAKLFEPEYAEIQLPGQAFPSFQLIEAFVPSSGQQQNLTAFLAAGSGKGNGGRVTAYVTPSGELADGPLLAASRIAASSSVAKELTVLSQYGASVHEGTLMVVPIDQSMLYVLPIYVQSTSKPLPEVKEVVLVYGNKVAMGPTLSAALADIFGSNVSKAQSSPSSGGSTGAAAAQAIREADADLARAQADLAAKNLAGYQQEVDKAKSLLDKASAESQAAASSNSSVSTPTTTPTSKGPST